ncbi:MAG: hypothetical protein HRT68_08900 [Flavobacteriaceae bacterium]|nr:hypothetical protein [Flavobacteriaceae bacterium]
MSDFICIQTNQGRLYFTVIIDLYCRKVIGCFIRNDLNTENSIIPVWGMAVKNNPINNKLIFHSDSDSQYA